jgi:hypothetical protein
VTADDPAAVLQRWADAGAVWRVIDRISSTDPHLLRFLAGRTSSEE